MDDDTFDQLVDDASHAVNNLIPTGALAKLSQEECSNLLVRINDALSPILADIVR